MQMSRRLGKGIKTTATNECAATALIACTGV